MGNEAIVDEDGIAALAGLVLERQGDQVAEPSAGQHVLVGEEPVVGRHRELVTARHRLGDEVATHPACGCGGHGCGEEEPDVRTVPRSRTLDGRRKPKCSRGLDEGSDVVSPRLLVEVGRQEPACVVLEERIDPDHVTTLEMVEDHLIAHGDERLIRALAALDARLLADAAHPLVRAGGRVALSIRAGVDPQLGEDVVAPAEEAAEQGDLLPGRGGRWQRYAAVHILRRCAELRLQRPDPSLRLLAFAFKPADERLLTVDRREELVLGPHDGSPFRPPSVELIPRAQAVVGRGESAPG